MSLFNFYDYKTKYDIITCWNGTGIDTRTQSMMHETILHFNKFHSVECRFYSFGFVQLLRGAKAYQHEMK